jgi:hypothetical protein
MVLESVRECDRHEILDEGRVKGEDVRVQPRLWYHHGVRIVLKMVLERC